jgi:hypothetical protein
MRNQIKPLVCGLKEKTMHHTKMLANLSMDKIKLKAMDMMHPNYELMNAIPTKQKTLILESFLQKPCDLTIRVR